MKKYEFGAVSSKYQLEAENKLTAYVAMVCFYDQNAFMVVVYSPEECKDDSWVSFDGKIAKRLHEIFGGKEGEPDAFDKYFYEHKEEVKAAYKSIKQLV